MSRQSGWQLSGNAPEAYERYIIPAFMGEWAKDLVEVATVRGGERVLDIACGTGVVTRQAAAVTGVSGQIVGLDVNAGMLDMARQISPPEGTAITWHEGNVTGMPFPDASFDVILCQQGLQYFPDRQAALREMARVLAPGGRLGLSVWRPLQRHPFFMALTEGLKHYVGEESAATLATAFTLGGRKELRTLIAEAGFQDVHVSLTVRLMRATSLGTFVPGYLEATPVAGAVAALDDSNRTFMLHDVAQRLASYMDDDGLAAPMECHVATAHV
jgi:ubiquinone/menaquinone biosynthesis C-methylase UbiE